MKTFVIAECGSCHEMRLDLAARLIDIAKECGADAAKFQFWSSAKRMASRRMAHAYQEIYASYQTPESWLEALSARASDVGIEFMCSTYLPEDVDIVAPFVKKFKIASFEANDPQHLLAHAVFFASGKDVFISMGMGARITPIVDYLSVPASKQPNYLLGRLRLLHCVSAYPTPISELNLTRLRRPMGLVTNGPDYVLEGFSDHSEPDNTWTGALAVAAGAEIIERHLRADDTMPTNPDYGHAMNPPAFKAYVSHIRFAETAIGAFGGHVSMPSETPMRAYRVRE